MLRREVHAMSRLFQYSASVRAVWGGVLLGVVLLSSSGCIRVMAIAGKMFIGDPKAESKFGGTTGVDLEKQKDGIILHCSAPLSVLDKSEDLPSDVESELIRRMKLKHMPIIDQNRVVDALDSHGGRYDTQVLMNELPDAKYLFEIKIERYEIREPNTPSMYHGRCAGTILGYEIEGGGKESDGGPRRMAQVFEQQFDVDYPDGHPIPAEQMSESSFRKKFVNELTKRLGTMFYDVTSKELF